MNKYRVVTAFFITHLANRFHKRQRLDIADRAADLDEQDVRLVHLGNCPHGDLYLVSDVRNDLYRLAEIIATTLFFDN